MGTTGSIITTAISIGTGILLLADKAIDFYDKIRRKYKEWSKKNDEENFNKEKNQYGKEIHNLKRNNRQYNKRPDNRNNYINDDYDYVYDDDEIDLNLKRKKENHNLNPNNNYDYSLGKMMNEQNLNINYKNLSSYKIDFRNYYYKDWQINDFK